MDVVGLLDYMMGWVQDWRHGADAADGRLGNGGNLRNNNLMAREQGMPIDGAALRAARERRGFGLRQFSKQIDISPATLTGMETGRVKVTASRLTKIGELLDCSVDRLMLPLTDMGGDGPHPAAPPKPHWREYPPLGFDKPLAAALDAFVEFGYHGANTRDIARRCGLSVPGLYYHYPTKQDMLVAILDYVMTDVLARSRAAIADGRSPAERFALLVECQTLFHAARRDLGFIGSSELRSLEKANIEPNRRLRRESKQLFDDEVLAGTALGEFVSDAPQAASRAVVSLCTGLPLWFRADGPQSPREVAAQYAGFALKLVGYVGSSSELLRALKVGEAPAER
jgi:AcrR family transcriptional regulator/DNA-binding Xre family transcriptional regulator